jgi:acyl carrier protein
MAGAVGAHVTEDAIEPIVKAYILQEFLPNTKPEELTSTTPLIAGGILDSLATVRLVMFLEQQFGIEMEAWEVGADTFGSLERIVELVQRKRSAR